jgi:lambda family phage portal protein
MYAAAKSGRDGGWAPVNDSDVNDEIRSSSPQVRARVRQLVRDFAPFARAVDVLEALIVGEEGYRIQSRVEDRAKAQRIEDEWKRWCEECDIAGRLHFSELCGLAARQDAECGEYLIVTHENAGGRIPLKLQAIEPDRLSTLSTAGTGTRTGRTIDQGVEFDQATGRVFAYHVDQGEYRRKPQRIPADRALHGFHNLRPGQLRGISPFTPGVLLARDMGEFLDAEIDGAKMASKYLAFVRTPDVAAFQRLRGTQEQDGARVEEMENALIEYLRPGEDISIASSNRPGDAFHPFVRFVLRMLAVTTGVPYELLSGDYSGVNYSTMRVSRNDLSAVLRPKQRHHIRHLAMPVFRRFMDRAVLSGSLRLPGYWTDPHQYQRCTWTPPGMASIDPLKESKAHATYMDSLLFSPQEICAARGRDYENVLDEIQTAKKMQADRGIQPEEVSTALANSPSALDPEE